MITIQKLKHLSSSIFIALLIASTFLTCSSNDDDDDDDDCTKTITIPQFYIVGNQTYNIETTQEVPCDFPEPSDAELIEPPELENFTYQILNFNLTPDTGNNTSRLEFEIQLNNNNNFAVSGVPFLTVISDNIEFSASYSNDAIIPCFEIEANSNCILTYDQEESLNLGVPNTFEIINIVYLLTN